MATHHELAASVATVHWGYFDPELDPLLVVESGDTITIQTVSGAPEYMPDPPLVVPDELRQIHSTLQPDLGPHILTGPVAVAGAEPGDRLDIEILDIRLDSDWGWNVHKPPLAALSDVADAWTRHLAIDRDRMRATLPWGGEISVRPFFGILATAPPPAMGRVSSKPPDFFGGNMDNKELVVGTVVSLPVHSTGALFSVGDGHAAQGDGEVSLTALETCMTGTFEIRLVKQHRLNTPRAVTPTHYITHGFDPDLDVAAQNALRDMIDWLGTSAGLSAADAYLLCSIACDLHVTQLVNGNKGVHAMVAREIFGQRPSPGIGTTP
jgi:acetamidase/formamidase